MDFLQKRSDNRESTLPLSTNLYPYPSQGQANITLALLMTAYVISYIDRQILSLLADPIKTGLHLSDFQISLLQGFAFSLFFCILGIPLGRVADRYNRKWLIVAGMVMWSLMTVACGFAKDFTTLFICRMGVGIGEAALAPAGYSLLADSFRKERLVRASSLFAFGAQLGACLALIIGGYLIDHVGNSSVIPAPLAALPTWQIIFIIVGLPGLPVAAMILLIQEPPRRDLDSAVGSSTLATFSYLWSRRRDYAPLYLAAIGMGMMSFGGMAWFPTHVIRAYGLSAGEAGALLGTLQLAGPLIGTLIGFRLTERFTAKGSVDAPLRTVMIVAALAVPTFVAPLMPTVETAAGIWFVSLILQNCYYGNIAGTIQMITPNQARATSAALLTLIIVFCGLSLGSALIGLLSDLCFPNQPGGIGKALAIVGMMGGGMACIAAARGRRRLRALLAPDG